MSKIKTYIVSTNMEDKKTTLSYSIDTDRYNIDAFLKDIDTGQTMCELRIQRPLRVLYYKGGPAKLLHYVN